jgi:hypothetical protein
LLSLHGGYAFGEVDNGASALEQRFGAFPLTGDHGEPGSYFCDAHQAHVKLLATEPQRYEPRLAADTSFLLSLEGNDSNSPVATAHAKTLGEPVRVTPLNRLEFENAIRLLLFRRMLPEAEAATTLAAFAGDEETGRIVEAR